MSINIVQIYKKINANNTFDKSFYFNLSKEEQKIYKLTQCNTILNRDMLDKREAYLKNVYIDYKDIYGIKGAKFCKEMQQLGKFYPKKKRRVQFSNNIQYSRN